jgi:hypothetical protein
MTDELATIWKGAMVSFSMYHPGICLEELRKTTKTAFKIVGDRAEIPSQHPSNTNLVLPVGQPFHWMRILWRGVTVIHSLQYGVRSTAFIWGKLYLAYTTFGEVGLLPSSLTGCCYAVKPLSFVWKTTLIKSISWMTTNHLWMGAE